MCSHCAIPTARAASLWIREIMISYRWGCWQHLAALTSPPPLNVLTSGCSAPAYAHLAVPSIADRRLSAC